MSEEVLGRRKLTLEEAKALRKEGMARRTERIQCRHQDWEKVRYLSGGAGTYFLRCKSCGRYEMTTQYRRYSRRGKKVREAVGDSTG